MANAVASAEDTNEEVTTTAAAAAAATTTTFAVGNSKLATGSMKRNQRPKDATACEEDQECKEGSGDNGSVAGPPPPKKQKPDNENSGEEENNASAASLTLMPQQPQAAGNSTKDDTARCCSATTAPRIQAKAASFVERICKIDTDNATVVSDAATAGCGGGGGRRDEIMSLVSSQSNLVRFAERMLALQEKFSLQGRPTVVDIGYHYTEPENMPQIRTHGLLTQAERTALGITDMKSHGSTYGDGVYTASNPVAFHGRYGTVCILVARLKGQSSTAFPVPDAAATNNNDEQDHPTAANCYDSSAASAHAHSGKRIVALRSSAQCLALYSFPASAISTTLEQDQTGNNHVYKYHSMAQAVVDEFFNDGVTTELESQKPPPAAHAASDQEREHIRCKQQRLLLLHHAAKCTHHAAGRRCPVTPHCESMKQLWKHMLHCKNPQCTVQHCLSSRYVLSHYRRCQDPWCTVCSPVRDAIPRANWHPAATTATTTATAAAIVSMQPQTLVYSAPEVLQPVDFHSVLESVPEEALQESESNDCAICLNVMDGSGTTCDGSIVKLKGCRHVFHASCIQSALARNFSCPMCRKPLRQRPQGPMPSGTMTISYNPHLDCAGYSSSDGDNSKGSIVIRYELEGGIQKTYHPNPGVAFDGASRVAYLPNNEQGRKLLKRLKYAFECGLSFTVGRSMTTERSNVITWSSIHHKSSPNGGGHGFPDPNYFTNCNEELDALCVPSADDLAA